MKTFLSKLLNFLSGKGFIESETRRKIKVNILDYDYEFFAKSEEDTIESLEKYLNENCTICNECHKPIFPGMSIAVAAFKTDPQYQFTHGGFKCAVAGLFCGHWGEGKPIYIDWDKLAEEQNREEELINEGDE